MQQAWMNACRFLLFFFFFSSSSSRQSNTKPTQPPTTVLSPTRGSLCAFSQGGDRPLGAWCGVAYPLQANTPSEERVAGETGTIIVRITLATNAGVSAQPSPTPLGPLAWPERYVLKGNLKSLCLTLAVIMRISCRLRARSAHRWTKRISVY